MKTSFLDREDIAGRRSVGAHGGPGPDQEAARGAACQRDHPGPDLDHGVHHAQPRLLDPRHLVRHRRGRQGKARMVDK
jgi:hypothetical protein